jgi:hypothetical protein
LCGGPTGSNTEFVVPFPVIELPKLFQTVLVPSEALAHWT